MFDHVVSAAMQRKRKRQSERLTVLRLVIGSTFVVVEDRCAAALFQRQLAVRSEASRSIQPRCRLLGTIAAADGSDYLWK